MAFQGRSSSRVRPIHCPSVSPLRRRVRSSSGTWAGVSPGPGPYWTRTASTKPATVRTTARKTSTTRSRCSWRLSAASSPATASAMGRGCRASTRSTRSGGRCCGIGRVYYSGTARSIIGDFTAPMRQSCVLHQGDENDDAKSSEPFGQWRPKQSARGIRYTFRVPSGRCSRKNRILAVLSI